MYLQVLYHRHSFFIITYLMTINKSFLWIYFFPFRIKQEMLHILTIAVRKIIHVCIRNLKQSNIETQRECVSEKE